MAEFLRKESLVGAYAILESTLLSSESWRSRRSDSSTYEIGDFGIKAQEEIEDQQIVKDFWPSFLRQLGFGLLFLIVATAVAVGLNGTYIFVRSESIRIPFDAGIVFAFLIMFIFVIYCGIISATQSGPIKIIKKVFEAKQYVCPGWQPCFFSFGSLGVAVNGTHSLFFVEWGAVAEIQTFLDDSRVVLHHGNGEMLTIPHRFFQQQNGGDISWSGPDSFLELVDKHVPKQAKRRLSQV